MNMRENKTLILSSDDVRQIVRHYGLDELMDALIERMASTMKNFDPERVQIPARSGFNYEQPKTGLIEWMPLYKQGDQVIVKIVGYHPHNPITNGFPTIVSTISAYDTSTGHLQGLMDGVLLTALRTGAASAVASQCMSRPGSSILGLIGCGAQAVTQLHALSRVFDLQQVFIYDIDQSAMCSFEERCEALALNVEITPVNMEDLVAQSEIICTATSLEVGSGPLFSNLHTLPYVHINAVGSDFPGKVELPLDLLENSFVCPDFLEQAVVEGECQQLKKEDIGADILHVIQHLDQYKHVRNQRTVFDSTGWALEDYVAMDLLMECANKLGLGKEIEIENTQEDAKNPYHFLKKDTKQIRKLEIMAS